MSEDHHIVGEPRGEPLPAGRVGVRVLVPLSGSPSQRWSRDLSARLTTELTGQHPAIGHLRLNDIVHGDHIVLEGVESRDTGSLAGALRRAVDATNRACASSAELAAAGAQRQADAVAHEIGAQDR
jgi:hypothetical protein